jgi:hypothetical protein
MPKINAELLRLRLFMARVKALGPRPEGSNGAVYVFDNLSFNQRPKWTSAYISAICGPLYRVMLYDVFFG